MKKVKKSPRESMLLSADKVEHCMSACTHACMSEPCVVLRDDCSVGKACLGLMKAPRAHISQMRKQAQSHTASAARTSPPVTADIHPQGFSSHFSAACQTSPEQSLGERGKCSAHREGGKGYSAKD